MARLKSELKLCKEWQELPLSQWPGRLAALEAAVRMIGERVDSGGDGPFPAGRTVRARARTKGAPETAPVMRLTWSDYIERVKDDESFELRREVLVGARELFVQKESLASMNGIERKAIAGTYRPGEATLHDKSWGWFGSMRGAGTFMSLINTSPRGLSRALDHIPASGEVTEQQFLTFTKKFKAAFDPDGRIGDLATASRLLAMKRPDQFVAVNSANRANLCQAFGVAFSTLNLNNYWSRIIIPMRSSSFWQHPRPRSGHPAEIWDSRAAFLDSMYYEYE